MSENKPNYFRGIRTEAAAKKRWLELCKKHHPDQNPDGDWVLMGAINQEYKSILNGFFWQQHIQETQPKKKPAPKPERKKKKNQSEKLEPVALSTDGHNRELVADIVDTSVSVVSQMAALTGRILKRRFSR